MALNPNKYVANRRYVAVRKTQGSTPARRLPARPLAYHPPLHRRFEPGIVLRRVTVGILGLLLAVVVAFIALKVYVNAETEGRIFAVDSIGLEHRHVALVFGAGLDRAGGPSAMLYDRVKTAVDLYEARYVDKLLMTGDNGTLNYNEVEVMRRTAVSLGVPDQDIVLDYAGFSTWDSCYRARDVFGLSEVTLVTQKFHLPRALFACNKLGVDAIGVSADSQPYPTTLNELREIPALATATWNIVTNQTPRFLGPSVDVDQPQER